MAKAVAIAERKLAEAQAQKAGGDGAGRETEVPASDDTAMLEAVEKGEPGLRSANSSLQKVPLAVCTMLTQAEGR